MSGKSLWSKFTQIVSAEVLNVDIGSELVTKLFAAKNLKHFDDGDDDDDDGDYGDD